MTATPNSLAIDTHLADALCDWLDCREEWLWYSIAALSRALRDGHSCLSLAHWAGDTPWAVEGDEGFRLPGQEEWQAQLAELPISPEDDAPLVFEYGRLYLRRYWQFETELADGIRQRLQPVTPMATTETAEVLTRLFPASQDGNETDWQAVAAANALFQQLAVIAGGPGTGKTYTVTRLLALLATTTVPDAGEPLRIRMAAPTGKAAQRLGEAVRQARSDLAGVVDAETLALIPDEAMTLHRLLGVIPGSIQFRHGRDNPLRLDVLLVDEVSMIDLPLMTRLFRALPDHARVICLGDADQLPSVAAGSVLSDLAPRPHPGYSVSRQQALAALGLNVPAAEDDADAADYLSYLYVSRRFSGSGGIGRLAAQVMAGDGEGSLETLQGEAADVHWVSGDAVSESIQRWTTQWYAAIAAAPSRAAAFEALAQFRLLCPTRVGPLGSVALNEQILRRLNPAGHTFFRGQPIMVTRNHYGVGLFNGDIGLLWPDEHNGDDRLFAWFPEAGGDRPIAPGRLPPCETVYAMTIHKTQGSEFERVALVLPDQGQAAVSRELLYTGLTRARRQVIVAGDAATWRKGVARPAERHSGLAARIFESPPKGSVPL